MKIFITFGQAHIHRIGNNIFDKDTVACIRCEDRSDGREKAFELFGDKFFTDYSEKEILENLCFFPKGIIDIK